MIRGRLGTGRFASSRFSKGRFDAFRQDSTGPVFSYAVSVSGLVGGVARIGAALTASAAGWTQDGAPSPPPASIAWQWVNAAGPGANTANYTPAASDDLAVIYPRATPSDTYAARNGPSATVRYAPPLTAGTLPDVAYSTGSGDQTVDASGGFTGSGITYSVASSVPGVVFDPDTGIVIIPTGADATGTITVTATNSGGSAQSAFGVTISTAATAPAQMAAPVVSNISYETATVTRGAAPSNGGSVILSYELRYKATADVTWIRINDFGPTAGLTGLTNNVQYEVQQRASNAVGSGAWSTSSTFTTDQLPAITGNAENTVDIIVDDGTFTITISGAGYAHHNGTFGPFNTADLNAGPITVVAPMISGIAGTGETLTAAPGLWTYDNTNEPIAVTGQWRRDAANISGETGSTYVTVGSDEDTGVTYRESATDVAGTRTSTSNAISIPAGAAVPAQMAAPVVTSAGQTSISVDRAIAPANGGSAITSYDLRWQEGAGAWTIVAGIADPATVSGLTAATTYSAQTRAVNAVGAGAWSPSDSATTGSASSVHDLIAAEIGSKLVAFFDMTDLTQIYQTTAGSTAVTAAGQGVQYIADVSGNGNHINTTADGTARTATAQTGYVDFDDTVAGGGVGFRFISNLSTREANMEIFGRFDVDGKNTWTLLGKDFASTTWAGAAFQNQGAAVDSTFSGTITHSVNGTDVSPASQGDLYTDVTGAGAGFVTQSLRGIDLSSEVNLMVFSFNNIFDKRLRGHAKYWLVTTSLTTGERASVNSILGAT